MPNPSCARCPQDRLHGLHTSRHIYTCVMPSNTHYEGVNSLALTFTQNYSHQNENAFHHFFHSSRRWIRRRCVSLRDHPPCDPVQEKTEYDTNKKGQRAQANTNRPKRIVRDGNSNTHAPQGSRYGLLLPGVGLEHPRQLRGDLQRGRRQVQHFFRGKSNARLTYHT